MFGRKNREKKVELLTPELVQLFAVASVEATSKNSAATERWGVGTAEQWSADLQSGTITFDFQNHSIVGPVEVIGTYASGSATWQWAWANESLPTDVTTASRRTLAFGEANGLAGLSAPQLEIDPTLADDFAAATVEVAGLAGVYRAPTNFGFIYLGFTDFASVNRE